MCLRVSRDAGVVDGTPVDGNRRAEGVDYEATLIIMPVVGEGVAVDEEDRGLVGRLSAVAQDRVPPLELSVTEVGRCGEEGWVDLRNYSSDGTLTSFANLPPQTADSQSPTCPLLCRKVASKLRTKLA